MTDAYPDPFIEITSVHGRIGRFRWLNSCRMPHRSLFSLRIIANFGCSDFSNTPPDCWPRGYREEVLEPRHRITEPADV